MPDVPGNSTTTANAIVGGTVSGTLETVGDHDWYAVQLTAGQTITIWLNGTGVNSLEDPFVYVRNSSGALLASNDDASAGSNRNSYLVFTAPSTGTYYIDAGAWDENYTGTYELSINTLPVYDVDQIATQLTHGYWDNGDWRAFNVDPGGTITVNVTALTAAGQTLARAALAAWSDVIGVNFVEVTTGGQIVFDDSEEGAHATSTLSGHVITSSHVNVSTDWLNSYGTGLNSYSYQTYIHEIGHALGLGHGGDYNGSADLPRDAIYQNDGWPMSIMSYYTPTENSYFSSQGFTSQNALTPMIADIAAMHWLYGMSTTTRTGDTTYGFNSNAGGVFDANAFPTARYTIVDSGGTDTLDYSGHFGQLLINLNAETFSNIGGGVGNVSIGRGTIIENAIGGSNNDTIIANGANNVINGNEGADTVSYAAATAGVTVSLATSAAQATGGSGTDTLINIENLTGSAFDDTLTGNASANVILGGDGNDVLIGGAGADTLTGGNGTDHFYFDAPLGSGVDGISDLGSGDLIYLYGQVFAGISGGTLAGSVFHQGSTATTNAQRIVYNSSTGQIFYDADGSGAAAAVLFATVAPGTWISSSSFVIYSPAVVTVQSAVSYTLADNEHDLLLTGSDPIWGTGNAVGNVITGNSGANILSGLGGDDTLNGLGGNDILDGGSDNDTLNGGDGVDTASYATATGGVWVDLSITSAQNTNSAGFDTLSSIENLTGSAFGDQLTGDAGNNVVDGGAGNDNLTGGSGNDTLLGGSGDDILTGGSGDDTLDGGSGTNTASYWNASSGVQVSLALSGGQATGGAGTDTLVNITGLSGSMYNDVLTGNDGANTLGGGSGDDWLNGGAGADSTLR